MKTKRFIFVGPKPSVDPSQHQGGNLTDAIGICDYASEQGYDIDFVDNLRSNFPPPPMVSKLISGIGRVMSFVRKVCTFNYDGAIIFVGARHSFFERIVLCALARAYGIKTLFCIRDGRFIDWMRSSNVNYQLVRRLMRIPNRIIVQGTRFAKALTESGIPNTKVAVIRNWRPNAFEIASQPKTASHRTPLNLLFVGWLVKEKGIQELVDAFAYLKSRYDVALDIVGGGTLEVELRQRIANRGLDGVCMHGWMKPADIIGLSDKAHIFVLPTYVEGFPNALLEAMARGLPAVCSDVGAISESIHNNVNGFLIPPKNSTALIEAIENYLKDSRLVYEHSTATLRIVKSLHNRESNLAKLFSLLG